MQTDRPPVPQPLTEAAGYDVDPGKGWVLFAGIMLAVVGAINLFAGIAAIDGAQFYVHNVKFVIADLKTFGWFMTVFGLLQLVTAFGVFRNSDAARWAGIAIAGLNMLLQFF